MRSRMDRYYEREEKSQGRQEKNQELYNTVYNMEPLKIIKTIDNLNEIDLDEIKENFNSREEHRKVKEYRNILKRVNEEEIIPEKEELEPEKRIHDIHSVIEKAKTDRGIISEGEDFRKLRNTQYNILSNLSIEDYENIPREKNTEDKLKELINTITMKKEDLKKESSTNLLDDLMPSDDTETTPVAKDKELCDEIDKSFYSTAYDFTDSDFEDFVKEKNKNKVLDVTIKILIGIVGIIIVGVLIFIINNYFNIF